MSRTGLSILAVLWLLFGCSEEPTQPYTNQNSLTIVNSSALLVHVQFRDGSYQVDTGRTAVVDSIPDSVYSYTTIYLVPNGMNVWAGTGLVGEFAFVNGTTQAHLLYESSEEMDTTGETHVLLWAQGSTL
jgi:hypothetical protein